MDYILSLFSSSTNSNPSNEGTNEVLNDNIEMVTLNTIKKQKVTETYGNIVSVINDFLIKHNNTKFPLHSPAGGCISDSSDVRIKKIQQNFHSEKVYTEFMNEIMQNLPILLKTEMKRKQLTKKTAKEVLRKYLYK